MRALLNMYARYFEEQDATKERERVRIDGGGGLGRPGTSRVGFAVWDGEQVLIQGASGTWKPGSGRAVKVTAGTEARLLDHASSRPTAPRALGGALLGGTTGAVVGSAFRKTDGGVAIVIEDHAQDVFEILNVHRSSIPAAMRLVERVNRTARRLEADD